jgi:O-antigen ligase
MKLMLIIASLGVGYIIFKESEILAVAFIAGVSISIFLTLPIFTIIQFLVFLVPFQPIDSRYGSINMVIVYLLFGVIMVKNILKKEPLMERTVVDIPLLCLLLAFILSFSNINYSEKTRHIIYLISFFSNILIFYLIQYSVKSEKDLYKIIYILAFSHIIVLVYCFVQIFFPGQGFSIFGLEELTMVATRGSLHKRVRGPFIEVGLAAEYLVIQIFFQLFMIIYEKEKQRKIFWLVLLLASLAVLITTSNRGGIISLILGLFYFGFLFRKKVSFPKFIGALVFLGLSFFVINRFMEEHTKSAYLIARLEKTHFEGGIPDTRVGVWKKTWPYLWDTPIIGHGPRFEVPSSPLFRPLTRKYYQPHNLYLYLIYNIGFFGLICFLWLIWQLFRYSQKSLKRGNPELFLWGLVAILQVILLVFMIDQMKIEFLRWSSRNYQHFIFILFGLLVASSRILRNKRLTST